MKELISISNIHLESIDSTSEYAKRSCSSFDPNLITCVTADEQTAGRGRLQRKWFSPKGVNLYATFYFRLSISPSHGNIINLAQVLAASLISVLQDAGLSPAFKWPNDVQLSGKKIAGILCDTALHAQYVDLFLGIGVNVNMEQSELGQIDQPATSLKQETGHEWDLADILRKLQSRFVLDLELFREEGFTPFRTRLQDVFAYLGQTIRCFDGEKEWVGVCYSLNDDGRLNLILLGGQVQPFFSGDIRIVQYWAT